MNNETFYLIWNPRSSKSPSCRHQDYLSAKLEAERLCRIQPGDEFFVLQAMSVTKAVEVKTVLLGEGV